jgi:hypothetical protein
MFTIHLAVQLHSILIVIAYCITWYSSKLGSRLQTTGWIEIGIFIQYKLTGWAGHVARMGEKRNAYRLLVGKPVGKRLGRPRHRWVDNIRMDLGEVGWSDVDWIGLAEDRNKWRALVNSVLNLWVP